MNLQVKTFSTWVRLPTVFSGMCNAYAGWWIGRVWGGSGQVTALCLGMVASGLLLMAGMGLNDIADLEVDRKERPDRPLPSGALSLKGAWILVGLMMGVAITLQFAANPHAAGVGLLLMASIFLYNFALKGTWLGPASMGLCRFLNLLSGMALTWTAWPESGSLPFTARLALLSIWLYIVAVTYLARDEVQGNVRHRLRFFLLLLGAWIGIWVACALRGLAPWHGVIPGLMAMGYFLVHPLKQLWIKPNGPNTGRTVGALLRCLPLVDMLALFASGAPWPAAAAAVLFMLPGGYLSKRFYST